MYAWVLFVHVLVCVCMHMCVCMLEHFGGEHLREQRRAASIRQGQHLFRIARPAHARLRTVSLKTHLHAHESQAIDGRQGGGTGCCSVPCGVVRADLQDATELLVGDESAKQRRCLERHADQKVGAHDEAMAEQLLPVLCPKHPGRIDRSGRLRLINRSGRNHLHHSMLVDASALYCCQLGRWLRQQER